ncbi:MAG: demethylmenaquinone methyltransferase [Actinomycetes bacterium]|jgi:demethylmenaquinone methyltransferase/2-methoxy-6-polyprenyl-1,4-benzoquinol methylase|nr:demethylmenaquinone methyltransferase [Actinomycetes bacterium]
MMHRDLPNTDRTPATTTAQVLAPATGLQDGRMTAHTVTPEQKTERVYQVFQTISDDYDRMNDVISFGRHRAWKRELIRAIRSCKPARVLDVASGTGDIALKLARACPSADIVAGDFSENMLAVADRRFRAAGVTNIRVLHENAMALSFPDDTFDVACISFGLRNMPDYAAVISQMTRVLRPGGYFFCLDSSYPTNPVVKPFFRLYFKHLMPLFGRLVAHAPDEYRWLNDSTEAFLSKGQLAVLMQHCGLTGVGVRSFMLGGAALHWGRKPDAHTTPAVGELDV